MWEQPFLHLDGSQEPMAFNAAHMALIPTPTTAGGVDLQGKVIVLNDTPAGSSFQLWAIVDPELPQTDSTKFRNFALQLPRSNVESGNPDDGDINCSGHAWTKEGNFFVAGGSIWSKTAPRALVKGSRLAYLWDPREWNDTTKKNGWHLLQPTPGKLLAQGRWYTTVTRLGDNAFVVAGGADVANSFPSTYEVFRVSATPPHQTGDWDANNGNRIYAGPPSASGHADIFFVYPWLHLLTPGQFFMGGFGKDGARASHDASKTTTWDDQVGQWTGQNPGPGTFLHNGTAVLFPLNLNVDPPFHDHVMRLGGAPGPINQWGTPTNKVEWCNANPPSGSSSWQTDLPSMTWAHHFPNAVILPDGSILILGGDDENGPVLDAELFKNGAWLWAGTMASPRWHHATAVLLPSGKVFVGGGDTRTVDYQIYSPPYLFCGTRPTFNPPLRGGLPQSLSYLTAYTVAHNPLPQMPPEWVQKVVLIRPGSTTHSFDMEQRYIELKQLSPGPENTVTFVTPPNSNYAPKGWYMLWLVSNLGVPSVAAWVELK